MRIEPSARWVRARLGDAVVVDSRAPLLFREDHFPVPSYAFRRDDVLAELVPTDPPERSGFDFHGPQSAVTRWYDVRAGGRTAPAAAWELADPALDGRVVLSWAPGGLDWTEEDEPVAGHPRDPYHRVDALPSSRHVVVRVDGRVVADSHRPVVVFETSLPMRCYLPADDVDLERLTPSATTSHCPYKGDADRYWHVGGLTDVAWAYTDPFPAVRAIADRICFYDERVDVELDGVAQERPVSPFSEEAHRPGAG